jgi:hypothetical protein
VYKGSQEAGNVVTLNISTYGVSCEVQGNLAAVKAYLSGCQDWISLTDPNHDVKNHRYQLIGGSSPASVGYFVFDSFLLKLAGVAKELIGVKDFASDALPMQLASISTIRKVIEFGAPDISNTTVTVVSLALMRLQSYAVNGRKVTWRDRAMYSWVTMLWITYTPGSTMMANKRNIVLETVGFMFLVTRADVWLHMLLTSESNEHTYGEWRQLLREFNIEQLIRIVRKHNVKLNAIFESNLVTATSGSSFSGYAQTFPQFLAALQGGASNNVAGPVTVDLDCDIAAVDQLWDEVHGVIDATNTWMEPFLLLFGVTKGNGLSPFLCDIQTLGALGVLVSEFFKPPEQDTRGNGIAAGGGAVNTAVIDAEIEVEDRTIQKTLWK